MEAGPVASSRPDVSLIIPCFNEVATIGHTVHQVLDYMASRYTGKSFELILIDDGSTDGTTNLLMQFMQHFPVVQAVFFKTNQGRGAAIKAGIQRSQGACVILLDADLSYDVNHIGEILDNFQSTRSDVVIVSPYRSGGVVRGVPFWRLMLSRAANWILSGFFAENLSTVTCVVRGYRGDLIRRIPLFEEGKELHLEILRKLGIYQACFSEIPGRLIWKTTKAKPRRKNNLKVARSAKKHLLYGILVKPTHLFNSIALLFVLLGIYEGWNILHSVYTYYQPADAPAGYRLWVAIAAAYAHSPHTFFIAGLCLILGVQILSFNGILQVLQLQQEETLRHLLAVLEKQETQNQQTQKQQAQTMQNDTQSGL